MCFRSVGSVLDVSGGDPVRAGLALSWKEAETSLWQPTRWDDLIVDVLDEVSKWMQVMA